MTNELHKDYSKYLYSLLSDFSDFLEGRDDMELLSLVERPLPSLTAVLMDIPISIQVKKKPALAFMLESQPGSVPLEFDGNYVEIGFAPWVALSSWPKNLEALAKNVISDRSIMAGDGNVFFEFRDPGHLRITFHKFLDFHSLPENGQCMYRMMMDLCLSFSLSQMKLAELKEEMDDSSFIFFGGSSQFQEEDK